MDCDNFSDMFRILRRDSSRTWPSRVSAVKKLAAAPNRDAFAIQIHPTEGFELCNLGRFAICLPCWKNRHITLPPLPPAAGFPAHRFARRPYLLSPVRSSLSSHLHTVCCLSYANYTSSVPDVDAAPFHIRKSALQRLAPAPPLHLASLHK
jgi:hypothetical protein